MKRFIIVIIGVFLLSGCAGAGLSQQQEDALARAAGNTLGIVIGEIRPEVLPVARIFCKNFLRAKDLAEAQKLFDEALNYLSKRYTGDAKLGAVLSNALVIIGINESQATSYLDQSIGRLDPLTKDMLHKALLVVSGVCEVI